MFRSITRRRSVKPVQPVRSVQPFSLHQDKSELNRQRFFCRARNYCCNRVLICRFWTNVSLLCFLAKEACGWCRKERRWWWYNLSHIVLSLVLRARCEILSAAPVRGRQVVVLGDFHLHVSKPITLAGMMKVVASADIGVFRYIMLSVRTSGSSFTSSSFPEAFMKGCS